MGVVATRRLENTPTRPFRFLEGYQHLVNIFLGNDRPLGQAVQNFLQDIQRLINLKHADGETIQHVASGIFLYGAYGDLEDQSGPGDNNFWYIKAGIRGKWTPHGATILYGEYEKFDNGRGTAVEGAPFAVNADTGAIEGTATALTSSSEVDLWGLGVVQEIDAAAMSLWLTYRHIEADAVAAGGGNLNYDEFDYVKFGALINF